MALRKRLFFTTADTTAETVYTNTTGQLTRLESMTMANAAGAAATNIHLSISADSSTTRVLIFPVPAGPTTIIVYPNIVIQSTEILQLSSTNTDDVCVVTGNGSVELVA